MRILVIDDKDTNQDAAMAQLKNHDVTVVGSYEAGEEMVEVKHDFDVVLVDLLMPASGKTQGPDGRRFVGQEMPIGIFLALLAAKNGAKYVAVFTDSDHHSHPASACFDVFNASENKPTPFMVEGAKVLLSNTRSWVNNFRPDNLAEMINCSGMTNEEMENTLSVRAKNWRKLLDYLLQ